MTNAVNVAQAASSIYSFKNRVINGAMTINQRGTTATTNGGFPVDRFSIGNNSGATYTGTQDTNAPAGFANSLKITITGTATPTGSNQFALYQGLEGYNTYDLLFGTANAKTVTLSFWVNCSLTGTFGGALQNYAQSRSYPFSYTITSANTWQQVVVTIPGDTGGTWVGASNAGSMELCFGLSVGPTYSGPAGAWAGTTYLTVTGATNFTGTSGATFYLTGVQLEVGSQATGFDFRPISTEVALCQRYYIVAPSIIMIYNASTTSMLGYYTFPVPMRTGPTVGLTTTSPYVESVPWTTVGSLTGAGITYNNSHNSVLGGDMKITGTFSPSPSSGQPWLIGDLTTGAFAGGGPVYFSAEL